jgi:hypothetical protein
MPQQAPFEIKNLSDVITAMSKPKLTWETENVWWRGHAREAWQLKPSVHRDSDHTYELNIALRFRQYAPTRHHSCPPESDRASWLYLMQHYSLPTRLLDWTESPLVAAYFAVNEDDDEAGALWALRPTSLNKQTGEVEGILGIESPLPRKLFQAPFQQNPNDPDTAVAIVANQVDIRMLIQQSAFTIHGSESQPLEELPDHDEFLMRFEIPATAKEIIRTQLRWLGMTESYLFPDLEHLAKHLREKTFGGSQVDSPS